MHPRLSVIIPAYNELRRLPPFLESVRAYCDAEFGTQYEVVVVDDGSTDGMPASLEALRGSWDQLVVLRHDGNRGKGAAVCTGLRRGRGKALLIADADGAFSIGEEIKLRTALQEGIDIAIGSRLLRGSTVRRG